MSGESLTGGFRKGTDGFDPPPPGTPAPVPPQGLVSELVVPEETAPTFPEVIESGGKVARNPPPPPQAADVPPPPPGGSGEMMTWAGPKAVFDSLLAAKRENVVLVGALRALLAWFDEEVENDGGAWDNARALLAQVEKAADQ